MQLLLVALNFVLSYNSRSYITNTHTHGVVTTKNSGLQPFYED